MVSGKVITVMTDVEAEWFEETRDAYLYELKFTEKTDLVDLDRMLILELMTFRWTLHLASGVDYDGDMVDEKKLTGDIKLYCVDEATEILTQRGWARYDEVVPGESVYTLNTTTGQAEWQVSTAMHFGRGHKMHHRRTRQHSSMTTPGHDWPVLTQRGEARWVRSENLNSGHWLMLAADQAPTPDTEDDAFIRLAAWYVTEGNVTYVRGIPSQGKITQSLAVNPTKVAMIREALTELYGQPGPLGSCRDHRAAPYWRESQADKMALFHLSVQVCEDLQRVSAGMAWDLRPDWVATLSGRQARLFVETAVLGDGWVTAKGAVRLCQTQERTIRAFEMACALAGVPTTTRKRGIGDWELGLLKSRRARAVLPPSLSGTSVDELVDYEGIFWCPSTPNQTWLMRREGAVCWTGNSDQLNKVKESMGLSKKARDSQASEGNFASWLSDLKSRAKVFGVHRQHQLTKALSLMNELSAVVGAFDRSDEEERRKLGFDDEREILAWIRSVMLPEYHALDEFFRENEHRYWVRDL